jgi:zinc transport system substrate-binding protein
MLPSMGFATNLKVVTTLFPLYEFTQNVGGDRVQVHMLLPAGAEPHSWEPKPSDIINVSKADIFIFMGDRLEPWASDLLEALRGKDLVVLKLMKRMNATTAADDHRSDPHLWLDLSQAASMVEEITEALSKADPGGKGLYEANSKKYASRLLELDRLFMETLAKCETRKFVTGGHSAFGSLAERYQLEQIPLYGISPDAEPSPRRLVEIAKTMTREGLSMVFFEELVNPRLAEVLAEETGAGTMILSPAGNVSDDQFRKGTTFISIMQRNLQNLSRGLGCE